MAASPAATLLGDPFAVMNTVGLVAFAFVGASKAIDEAFDLLGIAVVGLAMAFAGGVTRDLLVTRTPTVLTSSGEVGLGLLGVALAVALGVVRTIPTGHPVTVVADAVGLGAFATTGAIVASGAGVSAVGVVAVAAINAVGGGALADVLLDRAPFILFEDLYATPAVLGGVAYWAAGIAGVGPGTAAATCAAVTVSVRLVAVTLDWGLPTVQALAGDGD